MLLRLLTQPTASRNISSPAQMSKRLDSTVVVDYLGSVTDSEGNPAMTPIEFGYKLCLPSNEEINMRYWETV